MRGVGSLGALARAARAGTAERRASRRILRRDSALLAPGIWVPHGSLVWRRLGATLPPHLLGLRGAHGTWRASLDRARRATPAGGTARAVALVTGSARHVLPPWWWVRGPAVRSSDVPGGHTCVVLPVEKRVGVETLVLLDTDAGRVTRYGVDVPDDYFHLRERFARHVPTAPVLAHGERWFAEGLVHGELLVELEAERQLDVLRTLLVALTALASAEAGPAPEVAAVRSPLLEDPAVLPPWFVALLHDATPLELLASSTSTVSHGDLGHHNVVVDAAGPHCIDLEPGQLERAPFWRDPLRLLLAEDPRAHRAWFLDGRFDAELVALGRAVGWPALEPRVLRERLVALHLLDRVVRHPRPGAGHLEELERLRRRYGLAVPAHD